MSLSRRGLIASLTGIAVAPSVLTATPAPVGRWHGLSDWDACAMSKSESDFLAQLKSHPCYGGLDLASVSDLTGFVLCWPVSNRLYLYPWAWIPEEGIAERTRKDNVPYADWVSKKYIETTPGAVTDWRFVTERIKQLATEYDIRQIGFDRFGARDTVSDLADAGIDVVEVAQGPLTFNAPMRRMADSVKSRTLVHTGHPVLRWNIDCCSVTQDANENIKPVKPDRQRGSKRIDLVVAAVMAIDCAMKATGDGYADLSCTVIG